MSTSTNQPTAYLAALDADSRRYDIDSAWGPLVWRAWGEGPPVALMHGGSGSWLHWVRTIERLRDRYTLLVPDLAGMGESATPPAISPVERLIEAIADATSASLGAVLDREAARGDRPKGAALGAADPHVVGFSFGGMVAAYCAASLGARTRSFVLVGGSGLGLPFVGVSGLSKPRPGLSEAELADVHRTNLAKIMFGDEKNLDALALHMQIINASNMRIQSHTSAKTKVMLPALDCISAPKHAIWGKQDPFHPRDEAAAIDLLNRYEMGRTLIDKAGHWVAYEAPDAFAEQLAQLLEHSS